VVEGPGGLGFLEEPGDEGRVVGGLRGHDLDRDGAVDAALGGLVDGAHAALADLREDGVARDGGDVDAELLEDLLMLGGGEAALLDHDLAERLIDAHLAHLLLDARALLDVGLGDEPQTGGRLAERHRRHEQLSRHP
jgi:hypothetical protein